MAVKKTGGRSNNTDAPIHLIPEDAKKQQVNSPKNSPDRTGKNTEKYTPDIQVHSTERDIPAEELSITKIALEQSRDKCFDLYEFAPLGYLTLNDKGHPVF